MPKRRKPAPPKASVAKGQRLPSGLYAWKGKAKRFSLLPEKVKAAWRSYWGRKSAKSKARNIARAVSERERRKTAISESREFAPVAHRLTKGRAKLCKTWEGFEDLEYLLTVMNEESPQFKLWAFSWKWNIEEAEQQGWTGVPFQENQEALLSYTRNTIRETMEGKPHFKTRETEPLPALIEVICLTGSP